MIAIEEPTQKNKIKQEGWEQTKLPICTKGKITGLRTKLFVLSLIFFSAYYM